MGKRERTVRESFESVSEYYHWNQSYASVIILTLTLWCISIHLYNLKRERYQQTFPDCYSFSRKSSCSKVFRLLFRSTFVRVGNCSSIFVNFYSKVVSFLQQGCNKLSNFYSKAFKNLKSQLSYQILRVLLDFKRKLVKCLKIRCFFIEVEQVVNFLQQDTFLQ